MLSSESKDILQKAVFFLVGAVLVFASFFLYLYPETVNWYIIIALSVLDFCYTAVNAYVLTDPEDNRLLKTSVILLIYYALFNAAPPVWFLFNETFDVYLTVWPDIILYSIFCGPLLIVVIIVVSIVLILIGIANGSGY